MNERRTRLNTSLLNRQRLLFVMLLLLIISVFRKHQSTIPLHQTTAAEKDMPDPFMFIAVIVSALIIPILAVILLYTIRGVARDHRKQVDRRADRLLEAQEASIESDDGDRMEVERAMTPGVERRVATTPMLADIDRGHCAVEGCSYLPETYDQVYDNDCEMKMCPALRLATQRLSMQEFDMGFPSSRPRMLS